MRAFRQTGSGTKAYALWPSGRDTDLRAKTDWTSDHRHGLCLETARTGSRSNAGSGLMDPTSPEGPHTVAEYGQRSDGSVESRKLHRSVHLNPTREAVEGPFEATARVCPSMTEMKKLIEETASDPIAPMTLLKKERCSCCSTVQDSVCKHLAEGHEENAIGTVTPELRLRFRAAP